MMARVGNMRCDLILDVLTIPFGLEEGRTSSAHVDPRVLLPYLGEQYGAGILSHAVSWRVVDRALGWPPREAGDQAAVATAILLRKHCLESPQHLRHGWCLRDLRKLAENAASDEIDKILEQVEATLAGRARPE
jgi:hypothetical protein